MYKTQIMTLLFSFLSANYSSVSANKPRLLDNIKTFSVQKIQLLENMSQTETTFL